MENDNFLKIEDVAKELKTSIHTIRRWLQNGKLKGYRPTGGAYFFDRSQINDFIRNSQTDEKKPKSRRKPSRIQQTKLQTENKQTS
jgi:excisionase family DNA binding protein